MSEKIYNRIASVWNIIFSIVSLKVVLKIVVPVLIIALIIRFISSYAGADPNSVMGILAGGMNNFTSYISSCFAHLKSLFI
ncbi:MAG: hypothetical protein IJ853_00945 [Rickettsiales bacterium]|nr:hypothetical protein [Rickettsiales bacterium]